MINKTNWIGGPDEPLIGFQSKYRQNTTEIILWNDVFLHTTDLGEEIAIVLTQNVFDSQTMSAYNSSLFTFSALIRSVQFKESEQDNQFSKNLEDFVIEDAILIAVWPRFDGKEFIVTRDSTIEDGDDDENKTYDGCWSLMKPEFKKELITLIESLLSPDELKIKKFNNVDLLGFELNEYIKMYLQLFQSEEGHQSQDIYEKSIDKQMNMIVDSCLNWFKQILYSSKIFIDPSFSTYLDITYELAKNNTIVLFKTENKLGNHELEFTKILEQKIGEIFSEWKSSALLNHEMFYQVSKVVEEQFNATYVELAKYELLEMKILKKMIYEIVNVLEKLRYVKRKADNIRERLRLCKYLDDFGLINKESMEMKNDSENYNLEENLEIERKLTTFIEETHDMENKYDVKGFLEILSKKKEEFVTKREKMENLANIQQIKILEQRLKQKDLKFLSLEFKLTEIEQKFKDLEELHSVLITEFYEVYDLEISCEDKLMEYLSIKNRNKKMSQSIN